MVVGSADLSLYLRGRLANQTAYREERGEELSRWPHTKHAQPASETTMVQLW